MNASDDEFRKLIQGVRSGDPPAALELLERYSPVVLRLVRRRLSTALRAKFDSADFVQTVWAAFFDTGHSRDFDCPEDLIRFLLTVARNKLCDETRRRLQTQRYNVNREQSLTSPDFLVDQDFDAIDLRQPRPSQIAQARERWSQWAAKHPPLHRQILELRCQGSTFAEIALKLNVHERTARRVFERLMKDF